MALEWQRPDDTKNFQTWVFDVVGTIIPVNAVVPKKPSAERVAHVGLRKDMLVAVMCTISRVSSTRIAVSTFIRNRGGIPAMLVNPRALDATHLAEMGYFDKPSDGQMPDIHWITKPPPELVAYRRPKKTMERRLRYIRSRCGPNASLEVFAQHFVDLATFNGNNVGPDLLVSLKRAFEAYGGLWDREMAPSTSVACVLAHGGKVRPCLACDHDCFVGLSTLHGSAQKLRARKPEACDAEAPSKRPRVSVDAPRQESRD